MGMSRTERAQKAGQASKKHGAYAFESRGEAALEPAEIASLQELRDLVRTEPGRQDVREEISARLIIVARKVFNDMELQLENPNWWDSGVVKRGATWIAELRRWIESFPPEFEAAMNVTEMLENASLEKQGGKKT